MLRFKYFFASPLFFFLRYHFGTLKRVWSFVSSLFSIYCFSIFLIKAGSEIWAATRVRVPRTYKLTNPLQSLFCFFRMNEKNWWYFIYCSPPMREYVCREENEHADRLADRRTYRWLQSFTILLVMKDVQFVKQHVYFYLRHFIVRKLTIDCILFMRIFAMIIYITKCLA